MDEKDKQLMTMIRVLLLMVAILLGLALGSCKSNHEVVHEYRDSIHERVVHSIHFDTIEVELPLQSIEVASLTDSSHISTDLAESFAWILPDGTLRHKINNLKGGIQVPVAIPTDTIIRFIERNKTKSVEVERKLTWWEKIKIDLGGVAIAWAAVTITILITRHFNKLKRMV